MKNLLFFKKLIICSTLVVGAFAQAQGDVRPYKLNEIIPVEKGTEVVWRNWRYEYENHIVGNEYFPNSMARTTYLASCGDVVKYSQVCEKFYQDSNLVKYVFISTPGTCAERGEGQPAVCVGDLVKTVQGPLQARVVGIGSGVHYNSKTGTYSRNIMTQDVEDPSSTVSDYQKINEVWLLNR